MHHPSAERVWGDANAAPQDCQRNFGFKLPCGFTLPLPPELRLLLFILTQQSAGQSRLILVLDGCELDGALFVSAEAGSVVSATQKAVMARR